MSIEWAYCRSATDTLSVRPRRRTLFNRTGVDQEPKRDIGIYPYSQRCRTNGHGRETCREPSRIFKIGEQFRTGFPAVTGGTFNLELNNRAIEREDLNQRIRDLIDNAEITGYVDQERIRQERIQQQRSCCLIRAEE